MTTAGQNQSAGAATSEIGTVLAQRYEVVRELGRGGMGVVYLCNDVVTGDRVALKRLRSPEKGETRAEESWWFHQEARAVALLDHPAIVRARDFGQLADGSPFFVMDVLPGRSVHEWMHTTHLPWNVIWAHGRSGARGARARARARRHPRRPQALEHHARSGVHDAAGPARSCSISGSRGCASTAHDSRLDGVSAPEVAVHSGAGTVGLGRARADPPAGVARGPATDLYALGCVMYRVLAGSEVFEGNAQDVLRAHKRTPVPPPTTARRRARRRPASSCCACSRRSRGTASSSPPTRGARGMRIRPRARGDARGDRAEPPELARRAAGATRARSRRAS